MPPPKRSFQQRLEQVLGLALRFALLSTGRDAISAYVTTPPETPGAAAFGASAPPDAGPRAPGRITVEFFYPDSKRYAGVICLPQCGDLNVLLRSAVVLPALPACSRIYAVQLIAHNPQELAIPCQSPPVTTHYSRPG
jgi:hypothetical protein